MAVKGAPAPVSSTAWLATTLVIDPRTTRTVTVPTGRSPTGSGRPDICFGSGMPPANGCARDRCIEAGGKDQERDKAADVQMTSASRRHRIEACATTLAERGVAVVAGAAGGAELAGNTPTSALPDLTGSQLRCLVGSTFA